MGLRRKKGDEQGASEILVGYLFLLPVVAILLVFVIVPVLWSFWLSFHEWSALEPDRMPWVGLNNYTQLLFDDEFHISLWNTAIYTFWVVPIQTVLSLIIAAVLNQKLRGVAFFRAAFYFPSITSSVVITIIFMWIFNATGLFNYMLSTFGIVGPNWLGDPDYTLKAIMGLNIWTTLGTMTVIFLAGLMDVPGQVYEAAELDGAGPVRTFLHITVPLVKPTIFFVVVMGCIGCFQIFDQAFVASGGGGGPMNSTLTAVFFIYKSGFTRFEMGYACAAAFVLFLVILATTLFQQKILGSGGTK